MRHKFSTTSKLILKYHVSEQFTHFLLLLPYSWNFQESLQHQGNNSFRPAAAANQQTHTPSPFRAFLCNYWVNRSPYSEATFTIIIISCFDCAIYAGKQEQAQQLLSFSPSLYQSHSVTKHNEVVFVQSFWKGFCPACVCLGKETKREFH